MKSSHKPTGRIVAGLGLVVFCAALGPAVIHGLRISPVASVFDAEAADAAALSATGMDALLAQGLARMPPAADGLATPCSGFTCTHLGVGTGPWSAAQHLAQDLEAGPLAVHDDGTLADTAWADLISGPGARGAPDSAGRATPAVQRPPSIEALFGPLFGAPPAGNRPPALTAVAPVLPTQADSHPPAGLALAPGAAVPATDSPAAVPDSLLLALAPVAPGVPGPDARPDAGPDVPPYRAGENAAPPSGRALLPERGPALPPGKWTRPAAVPVSDAGLPVAAPHPTTADDAPQGPGAGMPGTELPWAMRPAHDAWPNTVDLLAAAPERGLGELDRGRNGAAAPPALALTSDPIELLRSDPDRALDALAGAGPSPGELAGPSFLGPDGDTSSLTDPDALLPPGVPEPTTLALVALAVLVILGLAIRRARKAHRGRRHMVHRPIVRRRRASDVL